MLKRVSRSKNHVLAALASRCPQALPCRAFVPRRFTLANGATAMANPVVMESARRWCATAEQCRSASCGAPPGDEEAVIRAAKWSSSNFEERLGFRAGDSITEASLKRHYYILAKHFHPDSAAGSGRASDATNRDEAAFQSVKEAYDVIHAALKQDGRWGGKSSAGFSAGDFAGGFEYADEARRRSQMRLLGDAVLLFMFMTVAFIVIVSRHNKSRMQSRYLGHLVLIFVTIQLFPRLLAAAILFAAHSMHLLENATLKEQAAIALIVERAEKACSVKLEGLSAEAQPNIVVQVTTTTDTSAAAVEVVSSTLTFDKGVTAFTLPLPVDSSCVYHIKAVDEARKLVLVDRSLSGGMRAAV
ncbi:hypothetical protein LSCM1_00134 [Leishmania martiniquensis]|uniref:J domain-containing protein n=1 Tax=Leishmania martiniquensis TaxID=1580590 RepID=A0A836KFS7_9TRYP|nr:hypothetical protein LSCM1_00134 [Leishmania martiniquensis]